MLDRIFFSALLIPLHPQHPINDALHVAFLELLVFLYVRAPLPEDLVLLQGLLNGLGLRQRHRVQKVHGGDDAIPSGGVLIVVELITHLPPSNARVVVFLQVGDLILRTHEGSDLRHENPVALPTTFPVIRPVRLGRPGPTGGLRVEAADER